MDDAQLIIMGKNTGDMKDDRSKMSIPQEF